MGHLTPVDGGHRAVQILPRLTETVRVLSRSLLLPSPRLSFPPPTRFLLTLQSQHHLVWIELQNSRCAEAGLGLLR